MQVVVNSGTMADCMEFFFEKFLSDTKLVDSIQLLILTLIHIYAILIYG